MDIYHLKKKSQYSVVNILCTIILVLFIYIVYCTTVLVLVQSTKCPKIGQRYLSQLTFQNQYHHVCVVTKYKDWQAASSLNLKSFLSSF